MHTFTRRKLLGCLAATGSLPLLSACVAPSQSRAPIPTEPARTAMLLPLTGPKARLGQSMAKAVWLVEDRSGLRQRVEIFDTGPSPAGAAAAARLADGAGAEVIVGPLFSDHTESVMKTKPRAQVISLSNDDRLTETGAWVFGVTPAHSAEAAVAFTKQKGFGSMAMLQPGGAFGVRSAEALARAARAQRVKLMPPIQSANPGDFNRRLKANGDGVAADSIYIPAADAEGLKLARMASSAGKAVIGSLQWADVPPDTLGDIKSMSFTGPDPTLFGRLSSSYQNELGEEMGIISGLAVDAVMLAFGLPRDRRGQIQLAVNAPVEGLLGQCSFRKDRTCMRKLAILQVSNGRIVKVG
ncbi:penicillin-binding protein activator [uncultured Roseobacter sp.]|uniref:penicillin-binding protein activator n=1 Tax=uncultured Roseobacter sp. TaxID=114847 RepID=UPI0026299A69|nr:penicillin-binding protein activator [uncultured Roseobacter sp.]